MTINMMMVMMTTMIMMNMMMMMTTMMMTFTELEGRRVGRPTIHSVEVGQREVDLSG
jgi:hypothetical protein